MVVFLPLIYHVEQNSELVRHWPRGNDRIIYLWTPFRRMTASLTSMDSDSLPVIARVYQYCNYLRLCANCEYWKWWNQCGQQSSHSGVIFISLISFRHEGPAWQVCWAHPKYESVIATCGYDKKINIWKEVKLNEWDRVYQAEANASVNCI